MKTNAIRILEAHGAEFSVREYEVDPEDLTAETVARKIGLPVNQTFKTLVVRGEREGIAFAVIAGDAELDLKAMAKAMGDKKCDLVALREVEPLTGYIRGGVTAIGARKDYPVFVDEWIEMYDVVSISGGARGVQVLLAPGIYLAVTQARVCAIAKAG